jgi:hypothetical protein
VPKARKARSTLAANRPAARARPRWAKRGIVGNLYKQYLIVCQSQLSQDYLYKDFVYLSLTSNLVSVHNYENF